MRSDRVGQISKSLPSSRALAPALWGDTLPHLSTSLEAAHQKKSPSERTSFLGSDTAPTVMVTLEHCTASKKAGWLT